MAEEEIDSIRGQHEDAQQQQQQMLLRLGASKAQRGLP